MRFYELDRCFDPKRIMIIQINTYFLNSLKKTITCSQANAESSHIKWADVHIMRPMAYKMK